MLPKRPERVLSKGEHQTVYCSCGNTIIAQNGAMNTTCSKCGSELNWGLRKRDGRVSND
jgi:predicted RNA-binding Zn-ribbon protein involved in translation (DUF1610 family)